MQAKQPTLRLIAEDRMSRPVLTGRWLRLVMSLADRSTAELCDVADMAEDLAPDLPGDLVAVHQYRRIIAAVATMPDDAAGRFVDMIGGAR